MLSSYVSYITIRVKHWNEEPETKNQKYTEFSQIQITHGRIKEVMVDRIFLINLYSENWT